MLRLFTRKYESEHLLIIKRFESCSLFYSSKLEIWMIFDLIPNYFLIKTFVSYFQRKYLKAIFK